MEGKDIFKNDGKISLQEQKALETLVASCDINCLKQELGTLSNWIKGDLKKYNETLMIQNAEQVKGIYELLVSQYPNDNNVKIMVNKLNSSKLSMDKRGVIICQTALNMVGLTGELLKIDAYFGHNTFVKLLEFQKSNIDSLIKYKGNLNGFFDVNTLELLKNKLTIKSNDESGLHTSQESVTQQPIRQEPESSLVIDRFAEKKEETTQQISPTLDTAEEKVKKTTFDHLADKRNLDKKQQDLEIAKIDHKLYQGVFTRIDDPELWQMKSDLLEMWGRKAESLYQKAMLGYMKHDYENVLNLLNQAIKLNPYYLDAYNLRGSIFWNKGHNFAYDLNKELISRVSKKQPVEYVELKLGDKTSGISGSKEKLNPSIVDQNQQIAQIDEQIYQGKFNTITDKDLWNKKIELLKSWNRQDDADYQYALFNYMKGTLRDGLAVLDKLIEKNPDYAEAYILKGQIYQRLYDTDKSNLFTGIGYRMKGNYTMGLNLLKQVVTKSPKDKGLIRYNMAMCYLGVCEQKIDSFNQTISGLGIDLNKELASSNSLGFRIKSEQNRIEDNLAMAKMNYKRALEYDGNLKDSGFETRIAQKGEISKFG